MFSFQPFERLFLNGNVRIETKFMEPVPNLMGGYQFFGMFLLSATDEHAGASLFVAAVVRHTIRFGPPFSPSYLRKPSYIPAGTRDYVCVFFASSAAIFTITSSKRITLYEFSSEPY